MQLLSGLQPPMAGNDLAVFIDQDRIGEAKFPDAGRDRVYLLARMKPGIASVRPQRCWGNRLINNLGHA